MDIEQSIDKNTIKRIAGHGWKEIFKENQ